MLCVAISVGLKGSYQFFSVRAQRIFLKFYIKLEGLKGQKMTEPIFSEKLITVKMMHNSDPYDSAKTPCLGKNSFFNYGLICPQPIRL